MDAYLRSARVLSVNPVTITIIVAYDPYYNLLSAEGFKPQSSSDGSIAKENSVYCYINLEFQNKNKFDPSLVKKHFEPSAFDRYVFVSGTNSWYNSNTD